MAAQQQPGEAPRGAPLRLRRLLPAGEPASAEEIVEELGLWARPLPAGARPHVLVNMVASADGRATLGGRSGPLSAPADRELFHALRACVDCVMMGGATVRTERYGRIIRDPATRARRRERGLAEEPLACIVSGALAFGRDIPLLADPAARVVVITASAAGLPRAAAHVEFVRCGSGGAADLAAGLAALRAAHGVELLLCEGGPHLASELFRLGLADELFLSVSPQLAGGEAGEGDALRILAGPPLEPPAPLELLAALERDSHLFLRYRARVP